MLTSLPANFKLIVSTIPNHGNLLEMITKMLRKKYNQKVNTTKETNNTEIKIRDSLQTQMLNVQQLTFIESETILNKWLEASNLCLTDNQWTCLRHIFGRGLDK